MSKFHEVVDEFEQKFGNIIAIIILFIIPGCGAGIALKHGAGFHSAIFGVVGFAFGLFTLYTTHKLIIQEPDKSVEKFWRIRIQIIYWYMLGLPALYLWLCGHFGEKLYS